MKIAILNFPINDVGGINSWGENIIKGFTRIGVDVQLFHCTPTNKFKCDENKKLRKGQRSDVLPGIHLSYNNSNLKETLQTVKKFDFIIFLHASPHPTKENLSQKDIMNWVHFYMSINNKKIVIFHDRNWDKTNKWFEDVWDCVDMIICGQKKFIHSANRYPGKFPKIWIHHPLDLEVMNTKNIKKKNYGIITPQWNFLKKHKDILPQVPDIDIPLHFYNNGMQFCNLRADGTVQKYLAGDEERGEVWNTNSIHKFKGFVSLERLYEIYAESLFSIDGSVIGTLNYTYLEPMVFRSLSFVETNSANDEDFIIPEDCMWQFDLFNLSDAINRYKKKPQTVKKILDNAELFIKDFDCRIVAKHILKQIQQL